ncbi:GntR family transcriptional regulator [Rarobacter incanus]
MRDSVLDALRTAIVAGTLAPDEQVRDAQIAQWLGVSRTPVREAILELARAGLVRATPGRITTVAPLDATEVRHAAQVVAAMHRTAQLAATPRLTDADIDQMVAANARFARAHAAKDVDAALAADAELHGVAVRVAANPAIADVLATYEPVLERAERLRFASLEGHASAQRHSELIDLCRRKDAQGAADLASMIWSDLTVSTSDPDGSATGENPSH